MGAIACPNCGAVHEPRNPGILTLVCDRCDSTLYLEDGVARRGKVSVVGEPRSNVRVGASGRVGDLGVEVLGRVRLSHSAGSWDEWYVLTADGRERWLIEDEKRYVFEDALDAVPDGAHPGLQLGAPVFVDGVRFEVREHGDARCDGGEGQLPRRVRAGEAYRYLDLLEIGGTRVLSIEFDADGEGEAFIGETVEASEVRFRGSGRPAEASDAVTASALECVSCGANVPLPRQADAARTAVCPNCSSILSLSGGAAELVGRNPYPTQFHLEVGDRGELLGDTYEVVGRMQYVDDEEYVTEEFLCWSEEAGYLWLEFDSGHFSYTKALGEGLSLGTLDGAGRGTKMTVAGRRYTLMARGGSQLTYVDGALPWEARHGDVQYSWTLVNPPHLVSVERSENELEVFVGAWLPAGTVEKAFSRQDRQERPWMVHAAQPNRWAGWRLMGGVAFLVAALNVLIAVLAMMWPTQPVIELSIPSSTAGVQSVESAPFLLDPANGPIMGVTYASQADNSWVYVDLELEDVVADEAVGAIGAELEYYHGYDDGYWSEGAQSETHWMRVPEKGTYVLSGTLEYDRPTPVTVRVEQGGMLSRYNICLVLPFGVGGILVFVMYFRFETARREDA